MLLPKPTLGSRECCSTREGWRETKDALLAGCGEDEQGLEGDLDEINRLDQTDGDQKRCEQP